LLDRLIDMLRIALLGLVTAWLASLARLAFPRRALVPVTVRRPVRRTV
jgi:ABC-type phosphate/phosphonate transport system permease subunit